MATFADIWALLAQIAIAAFSGGVAAFIGYYKKTPKEDFQMKKLLYTVVFAVFLVFAAAALGIPLNAPEGLDAAVGATFGYALVVYAAQAVAQLLYRRIVLPIAGKLGYSLPA